MKTAYSNTSNPAFIKWSCIATGILGVTLVVLYIVGIFGEGWGMIPYLAGFYLIYFAVLFSGYKLLIVTVDEENDTVTNSVQKKYPMHISRLTSVTYKESKKGKYRSVFLHDDGVGFMDLRLPKANADKMVAQLLKANPSIEVKHANYL